jgi:ABC-type transport system involved in multi-copper enzyme maturation permease subunit
MTTALLNLGRRFLSLSWLTGPIFEKELRVSSRRRRNYVLRFAYLSLLTGFLAVFWIGTVPRSGSNLNQISRMAEMGKGIIAFAIWFQFIATQIVALMMLSTSVSDEIYNRTLGLLMTTPINSFQIVIGKLFSKLLQIVLLMGISLPLLAIVRVFGGVPWMYVISSLCMTLTAVVFVGSLSLLFSVFSRRAYVVIIVTALTLGVLFLLLPYLSAFVCNAAIGRWPGPRLTAVIFYPNPYGMMAFNTIMMLEPRATAGIPAMFWPGHCGIMLAASVVVLFVCVCVVRRVALRQAVGQTGASSSGKRRKSAASAGSEHLAAPRRVTGPAVLWKELRTPMLGRRKMAMVAAIFAGLIVLFITYALCASEDMLDDDETHIVYVIIFAGLGMLFTIILPATCITTEKESQAWPLLLATTLSDWQILIGKFAGFVRRCLPIWFLLFGHVIIFTLSGVIHPVAIIQMAILVAWIVVFLFGTGVYFSARVRHTTTAVIANFALAGAIWALAPILLGLIAAGIGRAGGDLFEAYIATNPMVHAGVVMDGTTGTLGSYYWPGFNSLNAAGSTVWMITCMLGYMLLGVLFAWRAKCRFRRNIF